MNREPYTDEEFEAAEINASCLIRTLLLAFVVAAVILGRLALAGAFR